MKVIHLHWIEKIRTSAWTIPGLCALGGGVASQVALSIDHSASDSLLDWVGFIDKASPDGARSLLSTIATSMMAITGMSFSSIIVALTLASQQFGPRLLRNFIRDTYCQAVLGAFIGTFVYCLLVMRGVRSVESGAFVPHLSVMIAVAFSLVSLAFFIGFIHHIISLIQGERVVREAYEVLTDSLKNAALCGSSETPCRGEAEDEAPPKNPGWEISAEETGYILAVDTDRLCELAEERELVIVVECRAGYFVSAKQVILRVATKEGDEGDEDLEAALRDTILFGPVRTPEQDREHGILQLVEVALRALSPGTNDPFTAMNCIDYIGAGLQEAFELPVQSGVYRDGQGIARVFARTTSDRDLVDTACDQIRQAASGKCDVSCRMLEMIRATVEQAKMPDQVEALMNQAEMIAGEQMEASENSHDAKSIGTRIRACHRAAEMAKRRFNGTEEEEGGESISEP